MANCCWLTPEPRSAPICSVAVVQARTPPGSDADDVFDPVGVDDPAEVDPEPDGLVESVLLGELSPVVAVLAPEPAVPVFLDDLPDSDFPDVHPASSIASTAVSRTGSRTRRRIS
ncbi:MAG: hypothetical protein ACR2KJ_15745 [Jatrophihabitans sp.]